MPYQAMVTDKGVVRCPEGWEGPLCHWWAGARLGLALARYTEPGEPPLYVLQDKRAHGERESAGLDSRAMAALEWENNYQRWVDDPERSWGMAQVTGRATYGPQWRGPGCA